LFGKITIVEDTLFFYNYQYNMQIYSNNLAETLIFVYLISFKANPLNPRKIKETQKAAFTVILAHTW